MRRADPSLRARRDTIRLLWEINLFDLSRSRKKVAFGRAAHHVSVANGESFQQGHNRRKDRRGSGRAGLEVAGAVDGIEVEKSKRRIEQTIRYSNTALILDIFAKRRRRRSMGALDSYH